MKKLLSILLASAVAVGTFAFVGCGDTASDNGNNIDNTKPETPSDNDDYKSDNSKPVMPVDSDMQTVSTENVYEEYCSFFKKLRVNGYGNYKAYYQYSETTVNNGEQYESDGEKLLDKTEKTKLTKTMRIESSDNYSGIIENGKMIGAVTNFHNYTYESKVDSANPNLAYLNGNAHDKRTRIGIQKGSQIYAFLTIDSLDNETSIKADRELTCYAENNKWNTPTDFIIPSVFAIEIGEHVGGCLSANGVGISLSQANEYIAANDYVYLVDWDVAEQCEKIEVNGFEITAKKNETKLYASVKYTVVYTFNSYTTETVECNGIILFDLSKPDAVTKLPSDGINIKNLTLNTVEDKIVYPDLTSEQLTNAVKEGKELTVDIAGGGDVNNLVISGFSYNEQIPVVDGKVTIGCAKIKAYIEKLKDYFEEFYGDGDISDIFPLSLNFTYYYDESKNIGLTGSVYIDY